MAVNNPLVQSLTPDPWSGQPSGKKNWTGPLVQASQNLRNQTLRSLLGQLYGPSMQGVYEAGPADALAQQLRSGQQSLGAGLASRGLQYSGAQNLGQSSLNTQYQQGLGQAFSNAAGQETNRRMGLMQQLQGLIGQDVQGSSQLLQAQLAQQGAQQAAQQQQMQSLMGLISGGIGAGMAGLQIGTAMQPTGGALSQTPQGMGSAYGTSPQFESAMMGQGGQVTYNPQFGQLMGSGTGSQYW